MGGHSRLKLVSVHRFTFLQVNPTEMLKVKHRKLVKDQMQQTSHQSRNSSYNSKATTLQPIEIYLTTKNPKVASNPLDYVLIFIKLYYPAEKVFKLFKSVCWPTNVSLQDLARRVQEVAFSDRGPDEVDLYEEVCQCLSIVMEGFPTLP